MSFNSNILAEKGGEYTITSGVGGTQVIVPNIRQSNEQIDTTVHIEAEEDHEVIGRSLFDSTAVVGVYRSTNELSCPQGCLLV